MKSRALLDEFLGAVERIDQKEQRARGGRPVGGGFLGDDRNAGRQLVQSFEQDRLGVPVGLGHGRIVVLELDLQGAGIVRHDGGAGLGGGIGEDGGGAAEVEVAAGVRHRRGCVSWC